ncbi:hypothetical protein OIDMADRAFT_147989 [Oidiodendron maius Zn]|uniref:Uncharacterized protein n=1 Tax=Oidiodendron maius (strain Zn) TaxID=913774 RepID=A0A0C3D6U4_OIDMZ|nr:hypothetical protein OIDMADRAFT_147989 [Oidiodendron maius Zn]
MCAILSVFTMCHRQILAAVATSDTHALNSRHTGENTGGTDVDARAVTAGPSLVARNHGEDSGSNPKGSSNSKRGGDAKGTTTAEKKPESKSGGETSGSDETSNTNSKDDKAEKEKMDRINAKAKAAAEDYNRRLKEAKAKGFVYEEYDPNYLGEDY